MYTQRIVWHGDWKYIFSPGGVDELYQLADDPYEQKNLAADPQHRFRAMRTRAPSRGEGRLPSLPSQHDASSISTHCRR